MQALLSQLELLALKLPPDHPQRQSVAVALEQTAKLAAITQHLNRTTDYRTRQYLLNQHTLKPGRLQLRPRPTELGDRTY